MNKASARSKASKLAPQQVEASGVVMVGECTVRTRFCQALERGPMTAVWTLPARIQIDVCGACLHEKLENGDWHMEGTRPSVRPR
jgi:hypothetical protein